LKATRKVALLIETSNAYARGLLQGVIAYLHENQPWSLYLAEHGRGDSPPGWLAGWEGDGILARIETPAMARALKRLSVPIVDVSAGRLIPELPWFETDDSGIAQLAVEHLLERGFKHLAYCGDPRFNWSNWRGEHFARLAREAGIDCHQYLPARRFPRDHAGQVEDLARWLHELPKPVGVMACYDFRGLQILDACRGHGLHVPDEVAVIGVDNDEVLCELAHPPLSSVIPNAHRTGYDAAALLDALMAGRPPESGVNLIPPIGVATRQSSEVMAIDDVLIIRTVRFIRENACRGINVQDVLKAVPQSRRRLENQFRKLLGRTPHEEIVRVQLNRVKRLLGETDLSLAEIAERSGFEHVEYLSVVFKKEFGTPPSQYRLQTRRRR
jgi:LacI family transcriptional regulator